MSLSVPLPASPNSTKKQQKNTNTVRNDQRLSARKFSIDACQLTTYVSHSCDLVSHRVHILPADQEDTVTVGHAANEQLT